VNLLAANLTGQVRAIAEVATAVTKGDLTRAVQVEARGEVAELKDNINTMITNLRLTTDQNTEQDWLKTNLARFTGMLQGQRDLATVGRTLLSELVPLVDAHQGILYRVETQNGRNSLSLIGSYATGPQSGYPQQLAFGEGFVGQCAIEKRRLLLRDIPEDVAPVGSVLLKAMPRAIVVFPVMFEDEIKAVLGLGSLRDFAPSHLALLDQLTSSIGIVLNSIEATMQTEALLKQSQELAGELQNRQRELQQSNEQLEQKAAQLAERNVEVERKTAELALTSKYKSEFLANMSHELRTPLNSILILGQQLGDNPEGNLSSKQVEFARTIHGAGTDLLNLITDILDLSKIESGTVTVDAEEIFFAGLVQTVERAFRHDAERRGLSFAVELDPHVGRSMVTDPKRLQQVLKNLLSNAFKFTPEAGAVRLNVSVASSGWSSDHPILNSSPTVVAFEVVDSGIGIPNDKQKIIFEAFQQADAGTSRKYGGTGLGLAISRELASLLGGEIQLRSRPGEGSTFTLYLPLRYVGSATTVRSLEGGSTMAVSGSHKAVQEQRPDRAVRTIPDDRDIIEPSDNTILIIEDDPDYAHALAELARHEGFKVLAASKGADALDLARRFSPAAISLDIFLPDMLGWTVLSELKQDPATRHIPVQVVTLDDDRQHGLSRGAFSFITKPTSAGGLEEIMARIKDFSAPRRRRLLVVDDSPAERMSIAELLGHDDIEVLTVGGGREALSALRKEMHDCVVLDLRLPDMSGFEVLEAMRDDPQLHEVPVVVFTGKELSADEEARLQKLARSVVVKGVSPRRLLDETALFLHRVISNLPPEKQRMLERLHGSDEVLANKAVLVVDDDVRNIFALSSVLERRGMRVLTASTGREAVRKVESTPDLAIVLMDIMMPEMDGYETMQVIRQSPALRRLPIIALTAKAMKGDREKCLEAGASEYLAKPVNTDQLLSALRKWLHR
jgi:CheY-like chemotaxis protein/signal transduction histidine kinase/HAMP domain-containing protein